MPYFIYILYSTSSDIYYVGHTENVERRFYQHNNPIETKFTSKHLPWLLKTYFEISDNRANAMKAEKYIKKQKSKKFIKKLISDKAEQDRLVQLVRVPFERD